MPSLFRALMLVLGLLVVGSGDIARAEEAQQQPQPPQEQAQPQEQAPAPASTEAETPKQKVASAQQQEEISPGTMLMAWLACSLLSFVVTFLLVNSGKPAPLQYTSSTGESASGTTASGGTGSSAGSGSKPKAKKPKGGVEVTWRTFVLPLVWLPLPCMFIVSSLGASQPLVLHLEKAAPSEVIGFSKKRNDPGWLAASNDMREVNTAAAMYVSYAALGLISLNVALLLLLSVQAFAGRDPEEDEEVANSKPVEPTESAAVMQSPETPAPAPAPSPSLSSSAASPEPSSSSSSSSPP